MPRQTPARLDHARSYSGGSPFLPQLAVSRSHEHFAKRARWRVSAWCSTTASTRGRSSPATGRRAEDAGYSSLWVTERYFHEETFALLGHLAAATASLRLGVGVVNPYGRHPALTAMGAATLDRLSGGRFILGLGRSERDDVVEDKLGRSHAKSRRRLRETVHSVRALLAGERVEPPDGGRVRLAIHPVQTPLPIYLAPPSARRPSGSRAKWPTASC